MRLSWSDALPPANKLLSGQWFDGTTKEPGLSVDKMWVDMFHLKLGDTLTLRVGERDITARVDSIRGVDWDSFRVNFFLMLDPATGAGLSHSFLASFHVPVGNSTGLAALSRDYPNVSLVDINAILDRVRDIVDRVGRAAGWVLGFSVAAGVLVLLAALAATADERRFEIALLRTLGAHRRQLSIAVLAEFVALGVLAGAIAAIGAGGIGIALAERVFKLEGYWPPMGSLAALICAARGAGRVCGLGRHAAHCADAADGCIAAGLMRLSPLPLAGEADARSAAGEGRVSQACPHPNPLPQAGEGEERGGIWGKSAAKREDATRPGATPSCDRSRSGTACAGGFPSASLRRARRPR